jgi:hypothetical protein
MPAPDVGNLSILLLFNHLTCCDTTIHNSPTKNLPFTFPVTPANQLTYFTGKL